MLLAALNYSLNVVVLDVIRKVMERDFHLRLKIKKTVAYQAAFRLLAGCLFSNKPLLFVFEQDVEGGQCSIYPGDILLQVYFVFI